MEIKTEANLQEAFAGESQANRRYLFFADKAEKEGYPQAAKLFRAVAAAETVHARNHLDAMGGTGTTKENLMAGAQGEHLEFTRMYPLFIDLAEMEQNTLAQRSFEYANAVEEMHYGYFQAALKAMDAGQPLKEENYFVCQVCGNTVTGQPPDTCPVCHSPKSRFKPVE